jgi:hypothetical protein
MRRDLGAQRCEGLSEKRAHDHRQQGESEIRALRSLKPQG